MLIVDSQKQFLIDDTEMVLPKKRALYLEQQYRTSPPSEVFNNAGQQSTPAHSHFGGYIDEELLWNSTIMSNQEYQIYQQTLCGGGLGGGQGFAISDNKSYYSHQFATNNLNTSNIDPLRMSSTSGIGGIAWSQLNNGSSQP